MANDKQQWNPIEFSDAVAGMSTNAIYPGRKYARRILNLRNNKKPGANVLRPGFDLKYAVPSDPTVILTDSEFPTFETFVDRQADPDGQEIFCLIQKGKLQALTIGVGPIVEDTQNMMCFWCRPYWDSVTIAWIDEWQWINKTIITKIAVGSNASYPNMISICGGLSNGIIDNYFNRYTIYNKTKGEYAKVITSKNDGENTRICHSLYSSSWSADDVVILGKNWIELDYHEELFTVDWNEIVFHKTLNDLKIGFGGKEDRPGLSVGYIKKYVQLLKIDFLKHPDLLEAGVLGDFSKIDELVLDTNILNTNILNNQYGLILNKLSGGTLPPNTYSIRLTGIINGFEEQLLAESQITIPASSDIEILPYQALGRENKRITGFGIYRSTDGITFYLISKYNLKENTYLPGEWKLDTEGRLILISVTEAEAGEDFELHTEDNAASEGDTNSVGSWIKFNEGSVEVSTDAQDTYSLLYTRDILGTIDSSLRAGIIFPITGKKGTTYSISAYLKSTNGVLYSFFLGASLQVLNRSFKDLEVTNEFVKYDFEVFADNIPEEPIYFAIALNPVWNLFISVNGGSIYRSSDGVTWNLITTGLPVSNYYRMINFGTKILAAQDGGTYIGVYKSTDNGNNFTLISGTTGIRKIFRIETEIYGVAGDEIYRSDDDGETFTLVNNDDIGDTVTDIVGHGSYLFASTLSSGIFRSSDQGTNWSAVNTGLTNLAIGCLYSDGTHVFAGCLENGGFFRSDDDGANWLLKTTGIGDANVGKIIQKDSNIFITVSDISGNGMGVFVSSDDGDNWSATNTGLSSLSVIDLFLFLDSIFLNDLDGKIFESVDNGSNWTEKTDLDSYGFFASGSINEFYADLISIQEKSNSLFNAINSSATEMSDEMGYTPTYDLVKGWDQAIAFQGRTYFLNPYVEKRYDNFLLVSHIEGVATYLWDLASFDNYRELEKFEGNETIGIALLPTMEILILKDNSVMAIDPETGRAREPVYGVSCISRNSIQNIAGVIFWCGIEDMYLLNIGNGLIPKPLLKDTIRDLYLAITNKNLLHASRDENNSYRVRIYDALNKTEFLLTENGWIEEKKSLFPEIYRQGLNNKLYFLSDGNLYEIGSEFTNDYLNTKISVEFRAAEFNVDEEIKSNSRIVMGYLSAAYKTDVDAELYIVIYFQRTNSMLWESTNPLRLSNTAKRIFTKAPNGLSVLSFYPKIYGTAEELEISSLQCHIKELALGKHALSNIVSSPVIFAIEIPLVGNVSANSATVVWATTHNSIGRVIYGTSPASMTNEILTPSVYEDTHSVDIEDLEMETHYYCQIFATSEITGEEISSEILEFLTTRVVDLQAILPNPIIVSSIKIKQELNVLNQLGEIENVNTITPDAEFEVVNSSVDLSAHVKQELTVQNVVGNELSYSVTP